MSTHSTIIRFQNLNAGIANRYAQTLRSTILDAAPMVVIEARKESQETMDFGTTLGIVLAGPTVVAVANGIRVWLEKHHGVELEFETSDGKLIARNVTAANVVDILKAAKPTPKS
jgi:hypothetical protein